MVWASSGKLFSQEDSDKSSYSDLEIRGEKNSSCDQTVWNISLWIRTALRKVFINIEGNIDSIIHNALFAKSKSSVL